jgi:hypothetical protein
MWEVLKAKQLQKQKRQSSETSKNRAETRTKSTEDLNFNANKRIQHG